MPTIALAGGGLYPVGRASDSAAHLRGTLEVVEDSAILAYDGAEATYDATEFVQFYGIINNLFNSHYGLFGNYFNLDAANQAAIADGLGANFFTDSRTITPAVPFVAYGGIRQK